ncbi:MAG: tRNA lysidine(34) synthetase TilS [Clostridiales bacterium]|jgi:tRNA(Ile)-lysidine synthase|nr:tRNA lysidine(34) synthetase TilS [Clostridiales bacterium]
MLVRVLHTIHTHKMLSSGERVLVGLSGGPDSVALLHLLKRFGQTMGLTLFAAHVHHGIRGTEADQDADFVVQLCQQWDVPLFIEKFNVPELAAEMGVTEEEAGRMVRYRFFDQVFEKIDGHKIALGHHRDDQAETILHNILRGTGMRGLKGMEFVRDGKYIRPLLEVSRRDIEKYCRDNGLSFRIDATNRDTGYTRNRIRYQLIPYIQKNFNPNIVDVLVRMGVLIRDEDEFLDHYCREQYERMTVFTGQNNEIGLDLKAFLSCHIAVRRRILRMALERLRGLEGIQANHIDGVINMLSGSATGSELQLPGGVVVYKDYGHVVLSCDKTMEHPIEFQYHLNVPGKVIIRETGMEIAARNVQRREVCFSSPWCIYIDGDVIRGRLRVRKRRKGDRFKPFGMEGVKKLKDYFIDNKIPRRKRDSIPLVTDEHNIIWVVGLQIHQDYRITGNTKNIVELKARFLTGDSADK